MELGTVCQEVVQRLAAELCRQGTHDYLIFEGRAVEGGRRYTCRHCGYTLWEYEAAREAYIRSVWPDA